MRWSEDEAYDSPASAEDAVPMSAAVNPVVSNKHIGKLTRHENNRRCENNVMTLVDAQVYDGELLLVFRGHPAKMFTAKAVIADVLGCAVHLVTPGMMRRIRSGQRRVGESTLEFLARIAIIDTIAGGLSTDEPVIVRYPGVMSGNPVFRNTRVPPGPVFARLASTSADDIVRLEHPSLSPDEIEAALQQACRLLERDAPWVERR